MFKLLLEQWRSCCWRRSIQRDGRRNTIQWRSFVERTDLGATLVSPSFAEQEGPDESRPYELLRAQNVHRYLGTGEARTLILNGVSLSINRGEYVSIVGPSGSGKSTLLYLLGGLDRPDRVDLDGRVIAPTSAIFIDGNDSADLNDVELAALRNQKVGFVFQFHYLLKEFSAQENVALPMFKLGRWTRSEAMDRAATL